LSDAVLGQHLGEDQLGLGLLAEFIGEHAGGAEVGLGRPGLVLFPGLVAAAVVSDGLLETIRGVGRLMVDEGIDGQGRLARFRVVDLDGEGGRKLSGRGISVGRLGLARGR